MTKFWRTLLVLMVVIVGLFSATSLAINYSTVDVTVAGMDTVAGSPTVLTSSQTYPNTQVIFEVGKPDGSAIDVAGVTDASGVARVMFPGENTKMAGIYSVKAKVANNAISDKHSSFSVLAAPISKTVSNIAPADQVVRSADEKASVTVTLVDDYNNPISGHNVRLISSAATDEMISSYPNVTDTNGQIVFTVDSNQSGAVVYTAYDVTADFIINGKARVAYFDDANYVLTSNIPSNYAFGSSGNGSGVADHLSFEEIPMIINPGQNVSFKTTAYDAAEQVVVNYAGTVHFSVESGNASYVTLPTDYIFTPEDLGSHTFSVALGFQQPGSYQLRVQDTANPSVYGQFIFIVGSGAPASGGTVTIASPISGTYSNNVQVITGTATPGSKLKVFDNNIELTALVADISGLFSYTTATLVDGLHKFSVAEVNEVGTILSTSAVVEVNVDTSGVGVSSVVMEPSNIVDAGSSVTIKLYVTGKLSKASLILADNIYELTADPQGFYAGQVPAPTEFGDYPLSFVLKDELGNESKVDNQATLTVKGQLTVLEVVGDVSGLIATPEDKRVILNWTPVTDSTNPIKNYRVYVGSSPTELTTAIDTFTNATTWYVPNIENGTEYYFAVVAVDAKGNASAHFSNIVTATPNPLVVEVPDLDIELGVGGADDLGEMEEDASKSGPEVLWLILVSAIGGICYSETARRKKV
ncbi:MAG: Ig-like domain-containing protein [Candidatus Gracilibacteria bacterium]